MLRSLRHLSILLVGVISLAAAGCATTPHSVRTSAANSSADVYDPIEGFNRGAFMFNGVLDRFFIGPLAKGYAAVMPLSLIHI